MTWVPKLTETQAARPNQHCQHRAISREICSVISPRHDDFLCLADQLADPPIVARTENHRVLLDPRTVLDDDLLLKALKSALGS